MHTANGLSQPAAWDETQNENEGSRWVALGRKREIPRSKKKVLKKAGTGTDRTQIRQIQMPFPSEIKSFWSEQEQKQEMQRREGCRWEEKK